MASLFSSPPKPKAPPAVPSPTDAQDEAADMKKKYRGAGRSSTVLTSPTGVQTPAPVAAKTLLGA